ncbi:MAG: hypothetical protein VX359_02050 [Chloroflexota bacterium]|tara:strand:- start:800 stop:1609 length:810 start_codon:yes stop_codon:yes gene_type:complete
MKKYSLEILPKQVSNISKLNTDFFADVYITHIPGSSLDDLVSAASTILDAGFNPIPHIPARSFPSANVLKNTLTTLKRIGVKDLLTIGGSIKSPEGPYDSTISMYRSGVFDQLEFEQLRIAGHPEGNPDDSTPLKSLEGKLTWLRDNAISTAIVTQFCFSHEITNRWISHIKNILEKLFITDVEIHIGVAGPAKITTLIKYAKLCGVSASAEFLKKQGLDLAKVVKLSPSKIIDQLNGHDQIHFFPFGGLEEVSSWISEQISSTEGAEL